MPDQAQYESLFCSILGPRVPAQDLSRSEHLTPIGRVAKGGQEKIT